MGVEGADVLVTPAAWPRAIQVPVEKEDALWPFGSAEMETAPDVWRIVTGSRIDPPATPMLRIPFRLKIGGREVYNDILERPIRVVDDPIQVFEQVTEPVIAQEVVKLVHPRIEQDSDGEWMLRVGRGDSPTGILARMTLALRVEILFDGETVGIARYGVREATGRPRLPRYLLVDPMPAEEFSGSAALFEEGKFEGFHEVHWTGPAPAFIDPRRFSFVVSSDLALAWTLWQQPVDRAKSPRPRVWVGRFECPPAQ
jgi:hypothetical protein